VYNVNRAPIITRYDPAKDVVTKVNNRTLFSVKAEDPDGDELNYLWKFGLFESHTDGDAIARTFTIPGDKSVKVVVSDGKEDTEYVWDVKVIGQVNTAAKPKITTNVTAKKIAAKQIVQKPKVQTAKAVVQKPVVKKTVQTTVQKPIQQAVKQQPIQQQPKTKTGNIYDQYTITYVEESNGEVIGEDKQSIVVYSS